MHGHHQGAGGGDAPGRPGRGGGGVDHDGDLCGQGRRLLLCEAVVNAQGPHPQPPGEPDQIRLAKLGHGLYGHVRDGPEPRLVEPQADPFRPGAVVRGELLADVQGEKDHGVRACGALQHLPLLVKAGQVYGVAQALRHWLRPRP